MIFCIITGVLIGNKRGIPFMVNKGEYSIGIFLCDTLFDFNYVYKKKVVNPVITAKMVEDVNASFVADPFLIKNIDVWYMFFEVLNKNSNQGDIGVASSSDGIDWRYNKIVLDESFHISFPLVFRFDGEFYMIPESREINEVRLYKAENFPERWIYKKKILTGNFSDPSIFHYNNIWWMYTSDRNDFLRLFYSDSLEGTWSEHPESPIIKSDYKNARSAGRVFLRNDTIYRFAQDCINGYGNSVNAFFVKKITKTEYSEIEFSKNPILKGSGKGWNKLQMHHIDIEQFDSGRYIISTDGRNRKAHFGIDY
jgi:hypothetical protein